MNKKASTPQQQRATEFDKTPATGTSTCPHKGLEVAIVPVRYALDRSRYDAAPDDLKPLLTCGNWTSLPRLSTRSYTLRQLYNGYLYVCDETAGTFHEYAVTGADGVFTRIVWTQAQLGQDIRAGTGGGKPYLMYPKTSRLFLAFSPMQWSWRLCEHIRSHDDSRAKWMKPLDLTQYCLSMAEPGTLPLRQIADAVADVDKGSALPDGRFDDTSVPTSSGDAEAKTTDVQSTPLYSPVGSDAYWLGSVPDKHGALLIALDDPIAIMSDLGLQLAADQAAYRVWQDEHEHKLQMARTVTNLCASNDDPGGLPASVKNNVVSTQSYLKEVDDCLEQLHLDEIQEQSNVLGGDALVSLSSDLGMKMKKELERKYGASPSDEDFSSWKQRAKWRREIDRNGARTYIAEHQPAADRLMKQVRESRADFQTWAEHIGLDPAVLFVDTTHQKSLLYLQALMSELLTIYVQDLEGHSWLIEQEKRASTLFGTMRYGFSGEIKNALDSEANKLLDGINDQTNLATRVGELNSVLNHPEFAHMPWVNKLSEFARFTFITLTELAAAAGRGIAESMLMAWLPLDSRISHGEGRDLPSLLRSLMIGQVMLGSPHRIAIDAKVAGELKNWWREGLVLQDRMTKHKRSWTYPNAKRERTNISKQIVELEKRIRAHELKIPLLLDFQEHQYALSLQNEIRDHAGMYRESLEQWRGRADSWLGRLGSNLAAGITWGVIMLNLINTGLLYEALTRDGEVSHGDLIKVGYGLGYTFNLLAGVYVSGPWAVIKGAVAVDIQGVSVDILDRSAIYWQKSGNGAWAAAIRAFRGFLILSGSLGVAAAALEVIDINSDLDQAKSDSERKVLKIKRSAVIAMGLASAAQTALGVYLVRSVASFLLGPWVAIGLLIAGGVYILATMILNHLKQDSVGWWLKKSCWSKSAELRHPATHDGRMQELEELLKLQLSPTIFIKPTYHSELERIGKDGNIEKKVRNGVWIQVLLPNALRGNQLPLKIIGTQRWLGIGPVKESSDPIARSFVDNGKFFDTTSLGTVPKSRPSRSSNPLDFPAMPGEGEDVLWQSWIPLEKPVEYIEIQITCPPQTATVGNLLKPYLYQIELKEDGSVSPDGLSLNNLTISRSTAAETTYLEVM